jgi:hypothetical protein
MNISLDSDYVSVPIANTDLHAGGIFFCIVYEKIIRFNKDGSIQLTKRIIDPFRPMDDIDIELINNYYQKGNYRFNDRDLIICSFNEIDLELTGVVSSVNCNMLIFHAFDKKISRSWSEVYHLRQVKFA